MRSSTLEPDTSGIELRKLGFATAGCIIGACVGYLVVESPYVGFWDVLTRGAFLHGLKAVLIPEAQHEFNFMLAGAILGVLGGLIVASTPIGQAPPRSPETLASCPHCGTQVPDRMLFCAKCGKSLALATCRQCGKAVPPDQEFCGTCGTRVG